MTNNTVPRLSNLIRSASERGWCTKLYCTTCGALDFRRELRKQSNEEILEDLRALPQDFCKHHSDVLRLIFVEIALFPTCIDLMGPLEGTPAGVVLDSAIKHSKLSADQRREHARWSSPAAAKERSIARKQKKASAHKLRLEKKLEFDKVLRVFRDALSRSDFSHFFAELSKVEDPLEARAIGGMAYSALLNRLRDDCLSVEEARVLERCSASFGGHWMKLMRVCPSEKFMRPI